jgi:MFS family permease
MVVSAIMLVAIAVLFLTIREPKLVAENQALEAEHPEWNLAKDDGSGHEVLPAPVKRSLGFLLASIALWFAGYNGVTTWFTTYISEVMGTGIGGASTCTLVGTVGAIASYLPIGMLASRFGRKRMIRFGTLLLAACFIAGFALTSVFSYIHVSMNLVFLLVGVAWASINVNSLPMVVEMCKGSEVGKFTGLYYTFSMTAQIMTPIVAGWLLENVGYKTLFPYAAIFVFGSFLTMGFVLHGDNKVEAKKGLEAFDIED